MSSKRWTISPVDDTKATTLSRELQVKNVYGRLLVSRGIESFEEAEAFFLPDLNRLHDPFLMKDMQRAVCRIDDATRNREKILVYGDYDVDGTAAVAVVFSFLRERYSELGFYIPDRYQEGYGISVRGIEYAHTHGFTLIIALDCGIKAVDKIAYARSLGIDVIVCDHHLPDPQVPAAAAILNPKQPDCYYPYKELSGCGIGFKLITALARHWHLAETHALRYLDLVATAVAADIVPVTGENRILAFYGLKKLTENPLPGLKALLQLGGKPHQADRASTMDDLIFIIAPRVNAAGRMDMAHKAVHLFIEKDFDQALHIAGKLHRDNDTRRDLDQKMTREALDMLEGDEQDGRHTTFLYHDQWHKGVIGIVASRLMETYYRPTVVLTQSQDLVTGSARSVRNFNIYEALQQCHDLLENYGGHFYAAGMTLKKQNMAAFAARFESVVTASIRPDMLVPEISVDQEIHLSEITENLYHTLQRFGPFGPGNMRPVFMASGVLDTGYSRILKNKHIRFEITQPGTGTFSGIGFKMAGKFDIITSKRPFDICFTIEQNEWKGKTFIQLKVTDIRRGQ